MNDIIIEEEFENLIPLLSEEEYKLLEESIIKEGCREPLMLWKGILIDGHHRHSICRKRNISFKTHNLNVANRDEALMWAINNQLGRRNISLFDRGRLGLKAKEIFAKKAKERLVTSTGGKKPRPLTTLSKAEPLHTRKEVAKKAGIGEGSIYKVDYLEKYANQDVKDKLKKGEVSVSKAYDELRTREKAETEEMVDKIGNGQKPMPLSRMLMKLSGHALTQFETAGTGIDTIFKTINKDLVKNSSDEDYERIVKCLKKIRDSLELLIKDFDLELKKIGVKL